ncbi:MAG: hypothetical protein QOD39_2156 [Mycobacterium sp.]|nr:hypothetical protein [Mycobacterium sp.]
MVNRGDARLGGRGDRVGAVGCAATGSPAFAASSTTTASWRSVTWLPRTNGEFEVIVLRPLTGETRTVHRTHVLRFDSLAVPRLGR